MTSHNIGGSKPTYPKIFLYSIFHPHENGAFAYALAEDGSSLVGEHIENKIYARQLLTGPIAHAAYDTHYINGYELVDLVDLTEEQLDEHVEWTASFELNQQRSAKKDEEG